MTTFLTLDAPSAEILYYQGFVVRRVCNKIKGTSPSLLPVISVNKLFNSFDGNSSCRIFYPFLAQG